MSIVNGEDIEQILHREDVELASIQKRAFAFMIDELLLSFLLIVAMWDAFSTVTTTEDMILLSNRYILEYILMKIAYQTFFVSLYGATLGKMALHIRIINPSTMDKPSFAASLNRAVFRIISEMLFYLGFLWGALDPYRQAWHDKTAKTLVINA